MSSNVRPANHLSHADRRAASRCSHSSTSSDSDSSSASSAITHADLEHILARRSHELTNMFNTIGNAMTRIGDKISKNNKETHTRLD